MPCFEPLLGNLDVRVSNDNRVNTSTAHGKNTSENLARTFCDAMIVARKVGIKYPWTESLRIIQDSLEDWQHESALMGKFYSHCWCMLAAASSKDCHGGLFTPLNELPILGEGKDSLLLRSMVDQFDPNLLFEPIPLRRRGWMLQA